MDKHSGFMYEAIKEAAIGVKKKHGGPFGAVITKDGKIIAKAHNTVLRSHDPTSHAEISAIRKASKKLKTHDLSGCTLYTSCEPCPMCYGAIHWSGIRDVYYSATRKDASKIGFDDNELYQELNGKRKSSLKEKQIKTDFKGLFEEARKKRIRY